MLEEQIQILIAAHPYLLDKDLCGCIGRRERTVPSGRIDIDFETPNGTIVVECKRTPLKNEDIFQIRRYLTDLQQKGEIIYKAYLVGGSPRKPLNNQLLQEYPLITVKELIRAIPLHLKICRSGHYFDAAYKNCSYCGNREQSDEGLFIN